MHPQFDGVAVHRIQLQTLSLGEILIQRRIIRGGERFEEFRAAFHHVGLEADVFAAGKSEQFLDLHLPESVRLRNFADEFHWEARQGRRAGSSVNAARITRFLLSESSGESSVTTFEVMSVKFLS